MVPHISTPLHFGSQYLTFLLYDMCGFADSDYEYRIETWKRKERKRKHKTEAMFKRLYYNYLCFMYIMLIAFNFNFMQDL